MKLNQIVEALKPSQYRKYVKGWDKNRYLKLFKKYTEDDNAYRIYLPIKGKEKKHVYAPSDLIDFLENQKYYLLDYVQGLAYKRGDPHQRPVKIGKILTQALEKLKKNDASTLSSVIGVARIYGEHSRDEDFTRSIRFIEQVLKRFTEDPDRRASKDAEFFVVISRHPYDIAGMSTDRGWRSCMNLDAGVYKEYVEMDVKGGTLVAYVVRSDDKNINNPVGRVLIKPFISVADPESDDVALGIEDKVYGTDVSGFTDAVKNWVEEVNDSNQLDGMFKLDPRLYDDGSGSFEKAIGPNAETIKSLANDPESIEHIKNPTLQMFMAAINSNNLRRSYVSEIIDQMRTAKVEPSKAAVKKMLAQSGGDAYPDLIKAFPSFDTEQTRREAVENDPKMLEHIKDPSDEVIDIALQGDGDVIEFVKNPTEAQMYLAIYSSFDVPHLLDKMGITIPLKVWIRAYRKYAPSVTETKQPQPEEFQMWMVNNASPRHIVNPTEKVQNAVFDLFKPHFRGEHGEVDAVENFYRRLFDYPFEIADSVKEKIQELESHHEKVKKAVDEIKDTKATPAEPKRWKTHTDAEADK